MAAPTSYRLAFRSPHTHLIDVEARYRDLDADVDSVLLRMASWTPGSYLVRDYARHVQDVEARTADGRALAVTKIDKAAWSVGLAAGRPREIVVTYRVYAFELTVRTSHVDGSHAFVNAAPTFLWREDRAATPHEVVVEAPAGWRVVTALPFADGAYLARDLDELIDSPIHVGDGPVRSFAVAGRPHELAVWGRPDSGIADLDTLERDSSRIVGGYAALFGGLPYDRYAFLLMLAGGARGGLEHRASTALLAPPTAFTTRKRYEDLLELVSHEFFHLWNVKRLRPRALGRFDYSRENYTRALWVVEGMTSYYDRHMLRRVGLIGIKRYLEKLAEEWTALLGQPGRKKQSIEESSFDAWIKLYRPDENSLNTTVSYYLKGSLVCLALDLEIRRRTEGARSLDDALLALWRVHGQGGSDGYADDAVQAEIERAVDLDLDGFFARCVRGREDPDLAGELRAVGYELRPRSDKADKTDRGDTGDKAERDDDGQPGWLGATTRLESGRLLVASVPTGAPAEQAGLYAGDEIVAIDGFRVLDEKALSDRLAARRPGATTRLLVFRRDEEKQIDLVLGDRPPTWEIVPTPVAREAEQKLGRAWLGEE